MRKQLFHKFAQFLAVLAAIILFNVVVVGVKAQSTSSTRLQAKAWHNDVGWIHCELEMSKLTGVILDTSYCQNDYLGKIKFPTGDPVKRIGSELDGKMNLLTPFAGDLNLSEFDFKSTIEGTTIQTDRKLEGSVWNPVIGWIDFSGARHFKGNVTLNDDTINIADIQKTIDMVNGNYPNPTDEEKRKANTAGAALDSGGSVNIADIQKLIDFAQGRIDVLENIL